MGRQERKSSALEGGQRDLEIFSGSVRGQICLPGFPCEAKREVSWKSITGRNLDL